MWGVQARLVAVLARPDGGGVKGRLTFADDGFVYNLLVTTPGQRRKSIPIELAAGGVALVASLPYEVADMGLLVTGGTNLGSRFPVHIDVHPRKGDAGDHLVHIEVTEIGVTQPRPLPYYAQDVMCASGRADTYIPLALNEKPGNYTVSVRDVISGKTAQAVFQITHMGLVNTGRGSLMPQLVIRKPAGGVH